MEQVPLPPRQDYKNSTHNNIVDKAKRYLKIGALAGIGLATPGCEEGFIGINDKEQPKTEVAVPSTDFEEGKMDRKNTIDFQDAYNQYDAQHTWMNNALNSPEYYKRLQNEFGENAEKEIERRKKLLNDKYYTLMPGESFTIGNDSPPMSGGYQGYSSTKSEIGLIDHTGDVFLSNSVFDKNTTGIHEFTHDMTGGNARMSEKAKRLYDESFAKDNLIKPEIEDSYYNVDYYKKSTERDARKKQFEYDLDRLGVKKYGESYDWWHHKKAIELQKEGKLSEGGEQFLRMTKPAMIYKVMNEIATNKIADLDDITPSA